MSLPNHGANPLRLYKQAGIEPPASILDFSENIHPLGPPSFIKGNWAEYHQLLTAYPDPEGEPFRTAAAIYHNLENGNIAPANGAAEVFTWLARRYRGKNVALIEPAFSEYRQTLEAEHAVIKEIQLTDALDWKLDVDSLTLHLENCAALYICNPHNPTGNLLSVEDLKKVAEICSSKGCELVIDEAFIDFIGEEASFSKHLQAYPHVIIVRSMTKMYAIAGLRLGYVMASPETIQQLTCGAAHWNVNALAIAIGSSCFQEEDYRNRVVRLSDEERSRMMRFLAIYNCRFTDAKANFLSFTLPSDKDHDLFFHDMLKKGIVLRHTYSFKGMDGLWFRIGMKSEFAMKRLREEMTLWLTEH